MAYPVQAHELMQYEREKAAWLAANPAATGEQIEAALTAIAKRLGL
jgi:hypothetical protein